MEVHEADLEAVREALVPHGHRLGVHELTPDELARVLLEAALPGMRARWEAEHAGELSRAREENAKELVAAQSLAVDGWARSAAFRAQVAELEALTLRLEGERAAAVNMATRYREALARAARGEQGAAREALRA